MPSLKHLLRYIKFILERSVLFSKHSGDSHFLEGYSDSNYVRNLVLEIWPPAALSKLVGPLCVGVAILNVMQLSLKLRPNT